MDPITHFAEHVAGIRYSDLPDAPIRAAKIFILDTLGVGIAGSAGPMATDLADIQSAWGHGSEARVWSTGARLTVPAAAMCNAYQVHNSEFDCVHEEAVVHAMTVVLPVALAGAERRKGVSGRDLITAAVVGVDLSAGIGAAAVSGLRFFRPATAGAFGGTAALGKLMGLTAPQMINAFSIAYGQISGTMQAHTEGSMLLAMQVGFNARNAVVACDLAQRGFDGPKNVLEGPFGYFRLIEAGGDPMRIARDLGRRWLITEVAHKPYPSGRATHGIIDACLTLQKRHGFRATDISRIDARVPPLIHHLVGRPPKTEMTINYARLCAAYVTACALQTGTVRFEDFSDAAYRCATTHALAQRMTMTIEDAGNPNALTPIAVDIALASGARHSLTIDTVYGNPQKPMSTEDHLAKFRRNCAIATRPIPEKKVERLIAAVDRLEDVADVTTLVDLAVA